MFRRPIIIFLLVAQTVSALKCHVCRNLENANCLNIATKDDNRFLKQCPPSATSCGLEVTLASYPKVYRDCVSDTWSCKNGCYTCDSDGCNYGKDIKHVVKSPGVEVTTKELIMANIYGICAILLVTGLLLVWCLSRCCSKDDSEYDEEVDEEYDFEYEESTENEKTV